ncbi:MAG TPA: BadF/BadG/BcrA/BcrD ATPase family protein [Actinomycetota bacterium]|nr:BadF/BadG/BcrA/BcrD ATPase family protein [Actinomycetota bacterium]
MESLVLGGDLGGTSTRILVVGTDGREHGLSTSDGGNPISRPAGAATALGDALRRVLAEVDPGQVQASVIGVAGWSALRTPAVAAQFAKVWADAGLTCDPGYRPDLEVAFAAGTPEPDGTVLIAGTGATAGTVTGHRLTRAADGHGWLLGDDGSGFWLGREAVRAALRGLDAGEPQGRLAGSVLAALDAGTADEVPAALSRSGIDRVIQAVYSRPPVQLAALAPLVSAAYHDGDPQARSIVERAAAALLATVGRVRVEGEGTPIVLAGSLTRDTPVGATLRRLLSARFSGPIRTAGSGERGAAWLAMAALDPALATPATHSRLCR